MNLTKRHNICKLCGYTVKSSQLQHLEKVHGKRPNRHSGAMHYFRAPFVGEQQPPVFEELGAAA